MTTFQMELFHLFLFLIGEMRVRPKHLFGTFCTVSSETFNTHLSPQALWVGRMGLLSAKLLPCQVSCLQLLGTAGIGGNPPRVFGLLLSVTLNHLVYIPEFSTDAGEWLTLFFILSLNLSFLEDVQRIQALVFIKLSSQTS